MNNIALNEIFLYNLFCNLNIQGEKNNENIKIIYRRSMFGKSE